MLKDIQQAVIEGDAEVTVELVNRALKAGHTAEEIIDDALTPGIRMVGELFDHGEYFVPEMLISADAMKEAMKILEPLMMAGAGRTAGTVVMGTVKGDLHDIGKNLVITVLQSAGFEVVDLGVDVPAERFAEAVAEHGADVVGLGALLTTALPAIRETVALLKDLDPAPRVMIGGAAVPAEAAPEFGADGHAPNAKQAADLAARLTEDA
jgi:5-methyltetrahydrofolate--homocysteine methyltransferase